MPPVLQATALDSHLLRIRQAAHSLYDMVRGIMFGGAHKVIQRTQLTGIQNHIVAGIEVPRSIPSTDHHAFDTNTTTMTSRSNGLESVFVEEMPAESSFKGARSPIRKAASGESHIER